MDAKKEETHQGNGGSLIVFAVAALSLLAVSFGLFQGLMYLLRWVSG